MGHDRPLRAEQEKQRSVVRALHLNVLEDAGRARTEALRQADLQLDRIARLLPDALEGGLSLSEVARVTGVSRPTLYELRARYGDSARDLNLAVLQSLAVRGEQTPAELVTKIGKRRQKEVLALLENFADQGFIDGDVDEGEQKFFYWLTAKGADLLDAWTFDEVRGIEPIQS